MFCFDPNPPEGEGWCLTRCLTPGMTPGGTPPPSTDRASGQNWGVAPVISLSAGADRSSRARTKKTNNDGEKRKVGL